MKPSSRCSTMELNPSTSTLLRLRLWLWLIVTFRFHTMWSLSHSLPAIALYDCNSSPYSLLFAAFILCDCITYPSSSSLLCSALALAACHIPTLCYYDHILSLWMSCLGIERLGGVFREFPCDWRWGKWNKNIKSSLLDSLQRDCISHPFVRLK